MKKLLKPCLLLLFFFCCVRPGLAQKGIYEAISKEHFEKIAIQKLTGSIRQQDKSLNGKLSSYFTVNQQVLDDIQARKPGLLTLEIETGFSAEPFVLMLKRVNTLTPDFICRTSSGKTYTRADIEIGVQYVGVIKGQESASIASFCFFKNEIVAMISERRGNFTIGKLQGETTHIIYQEEGMPNYQGFSCTTKEPVSKPAPRSRGDHDEREGEKCVRVYVEVNDDIYRKFGSDVQATLNFTIGLFSVSSALFFNENIDLFVSEIYLWQQNGYTGPNYLNDFQGSLGGIFNGDIGHLLILTTAQPGGEAGSFGTFCNDKTSAVCYSEINNTYTQLPTYSASVKVITHEMGHLLGSQHTHACVWNGNNTAIDSCSSTPCYTGPALVPGSNVGTIMSYCDITSNVGVDLMNGFGPQPGDVIREVVNAAECLSRCCVHSWNSYQEDLSSPITQEEYHIASESITARNEVAHTNGLVLYRAGDFVALEPGFVTNISESAVFIAEIGVCDQINVTGPRDARVTGINEAGKTNSIRLFPNPVSASLSIQSEEALSSINIYNIAGKLVSEHSVARAGEITINLRMLSPGIYYVKVVSAKGEVSNFKISKL